MAYTPITEWRGDLFRRQLRRALNEISNLNTSLFDEVKTAEKTPIITLNAGFGVSAIRDVQAVTGSGAISSVGGEILLSTGATATSSAVLESAKIGTYIPGNSAQIGLGVRFPALPTGSQFANWGGLNNGGTDGFYFGVDATGFYAARRDGGTETKVRAEDFNIDKLDGSGASGVTLDLSKGYIFHIDYAYYGHGPIIFSISRLSSGSNNWIQCHAVEVDGQVSIRDPNLAIHAETNNGGDATDFAAYIGGRQFSIIGKYVPNRRVTGQERDSVSTSATALPLITFRRKSAFGSRSAILDGFTVDVGSAPVIVEVRINGALTGASYVTPSNVTAAETALEVDTSATGVTGGEVVWSAYFAAGTGRNTVANSATLGLDIPRDQPVTLCARTLSGTGSIVSHMLMAEEW
ncbi:hypothetical protein phiGT1_4 [Sulfitobacter phage phiGT1]|nr:hypothetical protein phiGT1_4 [Sulfitobacter phage phiGT1]